MTNKGEHHEVVPWFARGKRDHRTFIVAEIGNNHEGSLGNLIYMIKEAANCGVDAVKIQCHLADYEVSLKHDNVWPYRFSYHPQDKTRYDYWKRMSLDRDSLIQIQHTCDFYGVDLIISPFCVEVLDMINEVKDCLYPSYYKIASGEVNNLALIRKIKEMNANIILSTGMSDTREVNTAVCEILKEPNKPKELYVLQCTTEYPTSFDHIGMNVVDVYSRNMLFKGGLSDHSGTIYPGIIAAYLGAYMVEVHVCFSKKQFGADISSSLTFEELKQLVDGIDAAQKMRSCPINKDKYEPSQDAMKAYRNAKIRREANRYE